MAKVVGAELHLEAVNCLAPGDGHHAGVVHQDVETGVAGGEANGELLHRGQVSQVQVTELDVSRGTLSADSVQGRFALAWSRQARTTERRPGPGPGLFRTQTTVGARTREVRPVRGGMSFAVQPVIGITRGPLVVAGTRRPDDTAAPPDRNPGARASDQDFVVDSVAEPGHVVAVEAEELPTRMPARNG